MAYYQQQPEYVEEIVERVYTVPTTAAPPSPYGYERVYATPPPAVVAAAPYNYERVSNSSYGRRPIEGGYGAPAYPITNYPRNELGAAGGAGAFSVIETRKVMSDLAPAQRVGAAGLGALAPAGYAYYEHRQKDKFEDRIY